MKFLITIMLLLFCSCDGKKKEEKPVTLASTNYPVKWCIDYITGASVENNYPVPGDLDPAFWEPEDPDLKKLSTVDLVFINGATYEKWLETVSLGNTFDTTAHLKDRFLTIKNAISHVHDGKKHSHDGVDFNTWLDLDLFKQQAAVIEKKLSSIIKKSAVDFSANLKSLNSELDEVKESIGQAAGDQKKFLASHPVYGYLARSQGWEVKSFHWEPGEFPDNNEWAKLQGALSFSKYMLWEDTPSEDIQKKLKEIGVTAIVFRPCGNIPPSGDFIKEMKVNIQNLTEALKK